MFHEPELGYNHYAPRYRVVLQAENRWAATVFLNFVPLPLPNSFGDSDLAVLSLRPLMLFAEKIASEGDKARKPIAAVNIVFNHIEREEIETAKAPHCNYNQEHDSGIWIEEYQQ